MEITIHRTLNKDNFGEVIPDIFRFSYLMIDGGEMKEAVYCTATHMLQSNDGCFFTITHNDKKIAYGVFSYGLNNRNVRRLYYFAVEREHRQSGLGTKALKLAMETEVNIDHGCTVACQPELRVFYEKVGFKYYSTAIKRDHEIVLAYFNEDKMSIKECVEQIICLVEIQPESIEIFSKIKSFLKEHGIRPPKNTPNKKIQVTPTAHLI
ncbi:GNAT family N-acetyltransferase [Pseudoalteromonas distincta]|uniref:GNAT family N-acetyltransferase n=1 Tax=Pseudoalteromonas distincta TaxID=77608 RepID=UPI0011F18319|nr:GNAT family N-acetyltransferase [Pseudoalteromonas distincta]KAA1160876.1 GNAT family N-acetyltransferase [Pseudoalteromonas distincta]